MSAFVLICNNEGIIQEIEGAKDNPFNNSIGKSFANDEKVLDIQKALNLLVDTRKSKISANWQLLIKSSEGIEEYRIKGIIHRDQIILILEKEQTEYLDLINNINAEFSRMIRTITNEKMVSKRKFIETASHELRTPNTIISGYIEMLLDKYQEKLPREAVKWLKVVEENAKRLEKITAGIIKIEKVKEGEIQPEYKWFQLKKLVDEVIEENKKIIGKKMKVEKIIEECEVYTDGEILKFITSSIIDNASKFSPEKTIIKIKTKETKKDYIVTISDQGIGIDPRDYKRVFNAFTYIPKPDYFEGIGVSMALCKAYVELLDGEIWVESNGKNQGTVFGFSIPKP